MLCLGPGSVCDVCLDAFAGELKAPCSIECGHVFCLECLNHITRPACPLCRAPFDSRNNTKLHIDVDNVKLTSEQQSLAGPAELEARKFQDSIASIANEGSTETRLRQLIADCRAFLASYPRDQFQELRVSHRMVAYLCDVKSRLRSQDQLVESLKLQEDDLKEHISTLQEQNTKMSAELAAARDDLSKCQQQRREEREAAVVVEMKLRDHLQQTQDAHTQLVKLYNYAVSRQENAPLKPPSPKASEWEKTGMVTHQGSRYPAKRSGVEADNGLSPLSLLISPLPECSNTLPSASFTPLPELADIHPPQKAMAQPGCGSVGCPYTCNCQPVYRLSGGQVIPSPSYGPAPAHIEGTPTRQLTPASPGLLSMTAPRTSELQARTRSQSLSSRPGTRDHSPSTRTVRTSTVPLLPQSYEPEPPKASDHLRTRLHDLLKDNQVSASSSSSRRLPVHPPLVPRHEDLGLQDSRPHSRSDGQSNPRPIPTSAPIDIRRHAGSFDNYSGNGSVSSSSTRSSASSGMQPITPLSNSFNPKINTSSPAVINIHPPMLYSGTVSHASAAAEQLERVQRQEKEQRRAQGQKDATSLTHDLQPTSTSRAYDFHSTSRSSNSLTSTSTSDRRPALSRTNTSQQPPSATHNAIPPSTSPTVPASFEQWNQPYGPVNHSTSHNQKSAASSGHPSSYSTSSMRDRDTHGKTYNNSSSPQKHSSSSTSNSRTTTIPSSSSQYTQYQSQQQQQSISSSRNKYNLSTMPAITKLSA